MEPDKLAQWRAADALFDQWLDLPEAGREAWLAAQAPSGAVRQRLDQLIAAHRQPRAALEASGGELSGRRLGDWTLDDELGRGGMAVVYRAWREGGVARQQAAVKVLTLGALGAAGRERFQREAEILARLNHPNAATLIDSGVAEDGTCWLAMPLVEGERIDRWCDAHALDAHAIVRLYLQVCDAVAYAHRSLVIHRDLKPSNVLVDAGGHVRLLDFGIGQFADAAGERTQTMWRAMTPGYAAPEQLRGDPPGTAMDVYGLGALLHRLLTGRTPQATTGGDATTRPSLLVRDASDACHRHYVPLRNDLDRVLLKALADEPGQRYATADALADDLRRWLDGLPVLAQKPKAGYRLRKFVARNKAGVADGVLLAASLAGGVAATLWQAGEARREAANAKAQAQRAVLVRDFLERVFTATDPASGDIPSALELLDEGARRARSSVLATDPQAAADILMLTGKARMALDDLDGALADLKQAGEILAAQSATAYPERSRIEAGLSRAIVLTGETDAAIQHGRMAVELGERALADDMGAASYLDARIALGEALYNNDPHASLAEFEAVIEAIPRYGLQDTELHLNALMGLSLLVYATNEDDTERLVMLAEEILRLSRRVDGPDSGWYAHSLANQIPVFVKAGDSERAEQVAFEAIELVDRIYDEPHSTKAMVYCAVGVYLHRNRRIAESLKYYSVADAIYALLPRQQLQVASCHALSGNAHLSMGELHTALANLERAWRIVEQSGHPDTSTGYDSCGMWATTLLRLGEVDTAKRVLDGCPDSEGVPRAILRTQAQAELHFARGQFQEAARLTTAMRESHRPDASATRWMRPWMLSLLLARRTGDDAGQAALIAGIGDFGDRPPISQCIAEPDETNCLAVP